MSRASPSSGWSSPSHNEIAVDLPAPFGPSTASTSPRAHVEVHAVERDGLAVALDRPDELGERSRRRGR